MSYQPLIILDAIQTTGIQRRSQREPAISMKYELLSSRNKDSYLAD